MGETRQGLGRMWILGAIAAGAALATAAALALFLNIHERKQEAKNPYLKLVEVDEDTVDAAKWGMNWPRQYDGYRRTSEPSRTKYGGGSSSEGELPPEKAERDPYLPRMFAGYAFALEYRDRRGHAFMLQDQETTRRTRERPQPGSCLHCHASVMPLLRKLGAEAAPQAPVREQEMKGLEAISRMPYWDALAALEKAGAKHPVSCVDCHDPNTMELRVTRPGFLAGIKALKAKEGRADYDPNRDATRQEMRSYVCAQCHVEYYCGPKTTLVFPWANGLKVEEIEQFYDDFRFPDGHRFYDWTHAESGAEVLKAQHPEFEVWSQGVHARSGVACADCHMPYKREGALKVSEHWVKSPLLMLNRSCQTCHPYPEEELKARVEGIQDRHFALLSRAGAVLVDFLDAFKALRAPADEKNRPAAEAKADEALAKDPKLAALAGEARAKKRAELVAQALTALWSEQVMQDEKLREMAELQRKAQWRLDFVAAENSMGFHAAQELARVLGESIDLSRQGQIRALAFAAAK